MTARTSPLPVSDSPYALDAGVIDALRLQLTAIRALDRQLGANVVRDEVDHKIVQVEDLTNAVALPEHRRALLRLLCELRTLAGWLALDQLDIIGSWRHHNRAISAGREAESISHVAHATAQQAVVIADSGRLNLAVERAEFAVDLGQSLSGVMRAWLTATHGELLGLLGSRDDSDRAFDKAVKTVDEGWGEGEPYVGLDALHLQRWQVQASAQLSGLDRISATTRAVEQHDRSFCRAEASLRISLAHCLVSTDRDEAKNQLRKAETLCQAVRSSRQQKRASAVKALLA